MKGLVYFLCAALLMSLCSPQDTQIPSECTVSDQPSRGARGLLSPEPGAVELVVVNENDIETVQVIMILQTEGGTIENVNTMNYGGNDNTASGALSNDAGWYEFHLVLSANCNPLNCTLNLQDGLVHSYSAVPFFDEISQQSYKRAFQVVPTIACVHVTLEVPLTVPDYFNGTGGVLAIIADGLDANGKDIEASGAGYKGGPDDAEIVSSGNDAIIYATNTGTSCARKGTGFIGNSQFPPGSFAPNTYPAGLDLGVGAPGNAGGGGCFRKGGGGGANGGKGGGGGDTGGVGGSPVSSLVGPDRIFFGKVPSSAFH